MIIIKETLLKNNFNLIQRWKMKLKTQTTKKDSLN